MNATEFKFDEVTEFLQKSNSGVPSRTYKGFLGKSPTANYVRLYLTKELNEFLEIQKEDILHTDKIKYLGIEGSCIWVKSNAKLLHTKISSRSAQAEFLKGKLEKKASPFGQGLGFSKGERVDAFTTAICASIAVSVYLSSQVCGAVIRALTSDDDEEGGDTDGEGTGG